MDEQALIAACQAGNMERFGELYDAYVDRIHAFIYARTRHREIAEDITSSVWLKALDRFSTFRGGSFQAWLYQIARRTVIDHYRAHRPTENLESQYELSGPRQPEHDVAIHLQLEQVQAWLRQLPEDRREVVQLRLWDQLSFGEIAAITGKSEASCKMSFSRTLREIRSHIFVTVAAGLILTFTYVTLH